MSWINDIKEAYKIHDELDRIRNNFGKMIDEIDVKMKVDFVLNNTTMSVEAKDNIEEKMLREYRQWKNGK